MKKINLLLTIITILVLNSNAFSQEFEWRLGSPTYSPIDPDGAGPAQNSVTFKLQVRTRVPGSTIPISVITVGMSYQSANAMVPTGVACGASSGNVQPSNISTSAFFPGYTYNNVNHCSGIVNFTTGGQNFNRRAVGTFDGGSEITITNAWVDVYTTTLWGLNATDPQAGYVALNSTNLGTPGPNSNFELSNDAADAFQANSLTYTTPLALGSSILPVTFSNFTATCNEKGALLNWTTASEINNDYFEIQRSKDGSDWYTVNKVKAKGSASTETRYEQYDLLGGAAYYRIKQVDVNGTFTYSTINKTNCDNKNINVVIYPVPAKDVLNVVIRSDKAIKTQMEIYDGTGKLVRTVNTVITPGTNNFHVNINGLASGQYFIRSTDTDLQLNKKFTIMQ